MMEQVRLPHGVLTHFGAAAGEKKACAGDLSGRRL